MVDTSSSGLFSALGVSEAAMAIYRQGWLSSRDQDYSQAIQCFTDALEIDKVPDLFRARILEHRGECYWLIGEFQAAESDYRASITASEDPDQMARARVRLGEVVDFYGDHQASRPIFHQALKEGLAMNNLMVIGRARRGLGILNRKQGNTEQAINHLTQALAIFRQVGEAREQARVLISLGRTRHARGEYQHALVAHAEALHILESLNDRWRIVQALSDIGESHQALFAIDEALSYHKLALKLANEYGAEVIMPEIQRNYGIDLVEQGQLEEGLAYLQRALISARKIGNREQEALALYNLARAHLRYENRTAALQAVTELKVVANRLDADRYRALAAFVHGELLYQKGQQREAEHELNEAMLAAQTSVDRGVLWKLHATMSRVVQNKAIATVHGNIAAEFIRQTAEPLQDSQLKASFLASPLVVKTLQSAGVDPKTL